MDLLSSHTSAPRSARSTSACSHAQCCLFNCPQNTPPHTHTLLQAGPLCRRPLSPHGAPLSSLPPALSQSPGPPEPLTSVFPLLWQERRVSSLEAHSVACGRSTQTSHGCAAHRRGRQQAGLGEDQSWERVNDSQWGKCPPHCIHVNSEGCQISLHRDLKEVVPSVQQCPHLGQGGLQ